MASDNSLIKGFVNFKGLDLRSSDLERPSEFATEISNVDYRKTGAMHKRKGYQGKALSSGGYGLATYSDLDTSTGITTEKIVSVGSSLSELKTNSLDITYTGSTSAYVDFYLDTETQEFYLDLYDNNIRVLNFAVGVAISEAVPTTVADVITAINGVTDFSASSTGDTSSPAALIDITDELVLGATPSKIGFSYWDLANTPNNSPAAFSGAQAQVTTEDFENASFVNLRNVLYIATGYDALYKYDGTRLYKAGLPQASIDSVTLGGAGAITATNIQYKIVYEYTDAKGNIITGIESDLSAKISPSAQSVNITVDNILDTSGYDTDSTDLKIYIYRNRVEDSTTFYEVGVLTNDGTSATQVFNDNIAINAEGIEFIDPIKPHGLPPENLKYLTVHQGLLIASGQDTDPNNVYYSDLDSPEYFPPADNAFLVETALGDRVTGLASLGNSLFVFKNRSIHQITGTVSEDIFRVDLFGSAQVGCMAHNTIREVNGYLMFLSEKGVYAMNQNEQSLQEVSDIVEPRFRGIKANYNAKKATAIHWIDNDKYIIYLPQVTKDYVTEDYVMVYDYFRQAWLQWSSINALGGLTLKNNRLYFQERALRSSTDTSLYRFQEDGNDWDYADHSEAISFKYKSNWESLEEPSLFKKFTRCKIHSLGLTQDDFEGEGFKLKLQTELDYLDVPRTDTELDFFGSEGGWGVDPWGSFSWGATRLIGRVTKLTPMKCRSLRLVLQNDNLHENVLISGYEFEVAPSYKRFIKE